MQNHQAPVVSGPLSTQELPSFKAVNELHDTVVAQLHPLGNLPDAGLAAGGESAQSQHKEILLRLEVRVTRRLLAAIQINPDPVTEFRKGTKFRRCHRAGGHHIIISHPDIIAI